MSTERYTDYERNNLGNRLVFIIQHVRAATAFPLDGDSWNLWQSLIDQDLLSHILALHEHKATTDMLYRQRETYLAFDVDGIESDAIKFSFDDYKPVPYRRMGLQLRADLPDDTLSQVSAWMIEADKVQKRVDKACKWVRNVLHHVNTPGQFRRVMEDVVPFLSADQQAHLANAKKRSPVPPGLHVHEPEFILQRRAVIELLTKGNLMQSANMKQEPDIWVATR